MGAIQPSDIRDALRTVRDPKREQDIVSLGYVGDVEVTGNCVRLRLDVGDPSVQSEIQQAVESILKGLDIKRVDVETRFRARKVPVAKHQPVPGVRNILAVASGKGGVGKSTVSANLALALKGLGARVGLMDCDIYGPSVPSMFGLQGAPEIDADQRIIPHQAHGLAMVSMGSLVQQGQPVIWRGPMTHKVIQQFLFQVNWGELDFLVMDLPPGTGDVQLTLTQNTPLTCALIVTTPQQVSIADARKGYEMFQEVDVPVIGLVENMSWYRCRSCDKRHHIFGSGGGARLAQSLGIPLMAKIPILEQIPSELGRGEPYYVRLPESEIGRAFNRLAVDVGAQVDQLASQRGQSGTVFPMEV